jgi:hypothetical protein
MEKDKDGLRSDRGSRFRRQGSRLCHGLLGILFFVMMVVGLVALGLFAAKHDKIAEEVKGDDDCVLYTTKKRLEMKNKLSGGVGCSFTIWGSGLVAAGAGIFMLGYIIKTIYGASVSSCLVCVELPLLFLLLLASLSVSINTAIGLSLACNAFDDAAQNNDSIFHASGSSCKDYTVEGNKFFDDMIASAVSAPNSFNLPHKQTFTVTSLL